MTPAIVFHPGYDAPAPPGHRFPMGKFGVLADLLVAEGLAPRGFHAPEPADAEMLSRAHDPAYVARVLDGRLSEAEIRRIGLPATPEVALRARLSVGGGVLTARLALAHGIACNTAGGSHHAGPEGGAGFCVFNDVAVAALTLLEEGAIRRALVVDLDVHQGDGVARIFEGDPRVFTFSMHCAQNYPTRKARSDLDVPLERGLGDAEYLDALKPALAHALAAAQPDLLFYIAGVDVHEDDRLGLLRLSDAGIAARDAHVIGAARAAGVPLSGVLGGGYGPDLHAIARRQAILHRTAARIFAA